MPRKGQALEIIGHIHTSTYDKDGERQFSTELIVDQLELGPKSRTANTDNK
jgi:hypothetical protein